ncbi:carboxymuconolactone decarboxylase family protein [Rothia nasimurium]|uniref:carboxymuconolactone decarboxylase family protein n=1 Tax=Rothia nasimurium TaxID=85336 RepID=UPI002DD66A0B|nr:carboxymuconolactone decarboxylase family protein [Rothia nasimurium]
MSKQAGESARAAGLDDQLIELVCLRISQINGCAYARGALTDEQYSAVQWLAISMNAALENPLVAERDEDGRGAYEIFADSSSNPAGFTQFFTYAEKTCKPEPAHLRF